MARRALSDLFGPVEVVDAGLGVLRPASGASCWVYATGTTTPVTVYADGSSSTMLTLPVTTNSQGEPPGYVATDQDLDLVSVYKGNTTTSTATSLTAADVAGGGGGGATSLTSTATPTAAGQVPQSVGTTSRAVAWTGTAAVLNADGTINNLSAFVGLNVRNYGATGNGTTDDTTAVQNAQTAARTAGRPLYFPTGTYKLTSGFTINAGEQWVGDRWSAGSGGSQLNFVFSSGADVFTAGGTSGFTDTALFRDLFVHGDSVNTRRGWFCQSCRYFRWERLWVNGLTRENIYLYGQRNGQGLIATGFPGDSTHNVARDCIFVPADTTGTYDVVRFGGTTTACPTTITADGGTTITVADGTKVQGSTGTIVCADNGEQINFTGKSTNTLTGLTRAVNGTSQITHPNGTTFYVKRSSGASNMNTLAQVVVTGAGGIVPRYGVYIESGANNSLVQSTAISGMGSDGVAIAWYGNTLEGAVVENNTGHGVHFLGNYDTHGNWLLGQDSGGLNGLSDFQDDTDGNGWITTDGVVKLPNVYDTSPSVNGSLYRLSTTQGGDGKPRFRDASGFVHTISYTPRPQRQQTARNLITETYPAALITASVAPTQGTIYCTLAGFEAGDTIMNIVVALALAAVSGGVTPTLMKLAFVKKDGTVLADTGNIASSTGWTATTGVISFPLTTPYTTPTGDGYYLAFLQVGPFGTTQPKLGQIATISAVGGQVGGSGSRLAALGGTSQTDITGTLSLAAPGTAGTYWFGCN